MSPKHRNDGVFKVAVGVQLPVFLVHGKLIHVPAISSEVRPNDGASISIGQLRRVHMDADGPSCPFHPLALCFFGDIPQKFFFVQLEGKRPGIFRHLVLGNFPLLSSRIRLEMLLNVQD